MIAPTAPILNVEHLSVRYPVKSSLFSKQKAFVHAVSDVSFSLAPGETLGIVGESGCGKTTVGLAVLKLIPSSGVIRFDGKDLTGFDTFMKKEKLLFRKNAQIIFQDPYSSLNPRTRLFDTLARPMKLHNICPEKEIPDRVAFLFEKVGLNPDQANRFPHQLSGGQRQRVGIARALSLYPRLIIADEPVSALDVSIQAQIINLLTDLQDEFGFSYIFIAHDLAVVEHISERIAVMYLGKIVETAKSTELIDTPLHPYTQALFSAAPVADPRHRKERIILDGDVPSPQNPSAGCVFHPRCPKAMDLCRSVPPVARMAGKDHIAACHRVG